MGEVAPTIEAEGLAQQGDPTLSNRDVLTFNALVHAMHSFILHMQALDRRIEDVLVMRQPLDLRRALRPSELLAFDEPSTGAGERVANERRSTRRALAHMVFLLPFDPWIRRASLPPQPCWRF